METGELEMNEGRPILDGKDSLFERLVSGLSVRLRKGQRQLRQDVSYT